MNEDQIKHLIHVPFSHVYASDAVRWRAETPISRPRSATIRRRVVAFALGAGALLIAAIAMWPKPSAAAALKRVQDAITNARSMQVTAFGNYRSEPSKPLQEIFYENGSWLIHGQMQGVAHYSLVTDHKAYQWEEGSTVATSEPRDAPIWMKEDGTALDFVKAETGFDQYESTTTMSANGDIEGRPTYKLTLVRKLPPGSTSDMAVTCEIVVDKATDLPISTKIVNGRAGGGNYISTMQYQFNVSFPPTTFQPCNGNASEIRDLPKEREELKAKWATGLGTAKKGAMICEVRDLEVSSDGSVFMFYTGNPGNPWMSTSTFAPTELSTKDGTTYLRMPDFGPGALLWLEDDMIKAMTIDKHQPAVCMFIPLEPRETSADLPTTVGFAMRKYSYRDSGNPTTQPVKLDLVARSVKAEFPDWSLPLHLDYIEKQLPELADKQRGDYYKSVGKYADAARWYKQAYEDKRRIISIIAYKELIPAIECLEKAGDKAGELETKKQMLRDKAMDANLSEAERQQAKKELDSLG